MLIDPMTQVPLLVRERQAAATPAPRRTRQRVVRRRRRFRVLPA